MISKNLPKGLVLALIVVIIAVTLLATPECTVERQALQFDIDRYHEDLDPETCYALLEQINDHNQKCDGAINVLDCG